MARWLGDPLVVAGLRAAALGQAMSANHLAVLTELVFDLPDVTGKERVRFQRLLASEEARAVLNIIWKESDLVSEQELIKAGYTGRAFPMGISCHALGVSLAADKNEVAATVTRVRNVVVAACSYGLAHRKQVHAKQTSITATKLLHDVMLTLGEKNDVAFHVLFGDVPKFGVPQSLPPEPTQPGRRL